MTRAGDEDVVVTSASASSAVRRPPGPGGGDEAGYRAVLRLSAAASEVVGEYVHVITDDNIEAELAPQ